MGPELAFALLAAGAILAAVLRARPRPALAGGALLGLAGLAALLPVAPALRRSALGLTLLGPERAFVLAAGLALAMLVGLATPAAQRASVLSAGLAGLAGLLAVAVAPDPTAAAVVLGLVAAGQAALAGRRSFAERLRAPGFGLVLLAAAMLLAHDGGPPLHARLSALAFVLGLVAVAGLVPFLPLLDAGEPLAASPLAWTGFLGPALAFALLARVEPQVSADAAPVYGTLLVGIGLLNLLWGLFGAWLVEDDVAAWRYSFLADWGLALVGLGIVVPDGREAAYLVLMGVLLVRLPLFLWARPVLAGTVRPRLGPSNLVLAAALSGAAPFAGFSARLLLLRAATEIYWPLALVLAASMLLWLTHSMRLGQGLGQPEGRAAVGVVLALAISVALGVMPALALVPGGL